MLTLTHLTDEGHGWLVVTPSDAEALGLTHADLTRFSFVGPDGTLYAEEDCDAAVVLARHYRAYGCEPDIRERHESGGARCRRFASCTGTSTEWVEAHQFLAEVRRYEFA